MLVGGHGWSVSIPRVCNFVATTRIGETLSVGPLTTVDARCGAPRRVSAMRPNRPLRPFSSAAGLGRLQTSLKLPCDTKFCLQIVWGGPDVSGPAPMIAGRYKQGGEEEGNPVRPLRAACGLPAGPLWAALGETRARDGPQRSAEAGKTCR
jgi:hypothetical protein